MLTALINRYLAYAQHLSLQGINKIVQWKEDKTNTPFMHPTTLSTLP